MISIDTARITHVPVFQLKCSPITNEEHTANTTAPTAKPISRPGQTSPSKANAQYLVKYINMIEIGNPIKDMSIGWFFAQSQKNCDCN